MTKIIGLDPGISKTGWAIINIHGKSDLEFLNSGTISTNNSHSTGERLRVIFEQLTQLISLHSPDVAAIEKIFVNKNPKTSLTLGYARGITILMLSIARVPISEYDANYIKKSITGSGHADKSQIMFMVKQIIKNIDIKCHHAADALATAICHAYSMVYKQIEI